MSEQTKAEADGFPPNGVEVLVRLDGCWMLASYWRHTQGKHDGEACWGCTYTGDFLGNSVDYWEPLPIPRAGT